MTIINNQAQDSKTQDSKMKELLTVSPAPAKAGQILEGKVVEVSKSNIFIDFGPLGMGIILGKEIKESPSLVKNIKPEQMVSCLVLNPENETGYIEVSMKAARKELSWEKLEELRKKGEPIAAKIIQANRGGLLADVMGQSAFLPVSQLSSKNYPRVEGGDKNKILQELNKFVGKELSVKVIDIDQRQDKLIVSEKAMSKEEIQQVLDNFKIGDVFNGIVTAVTDFGAFVKIINEGKPEASAPEGLIHISELDWKIVKDPREIVKVSEKVKVKVIGFYQGRLSLSLKALKEKPQA